MITKILVAGVPLVALVAVALAGMHGAFATVRISERQAGPYEFVYRTAPQADYASIRTITTELYESFHKVGVREIQPFDIFFPPNTEANQIGFVVNASDLDAIMRIPNPPLHRTIAAQEYLSTALPYRSPFSFIVGFMKVDPKFREYREARGLGQTWAATLNTGDTIVYLQPRETSIAK